MALTAQQKAIQKKNAELAALKAEIAATPAPTMAQIGRLATLAKAPAELNDSARGAAVTQYQQNSRLASEARALLDAAIPKAQAAGTFKLPSGYVGEMKWHGMTDPTSVANWTPEQKALQAADPAIFESIWKQTATPAQLQRLNQVDAIVTDQRTGSDPFGKVLKAALPIGLSLLAPGLGTAIGTGLGASGTAASMLGGAVMGGATSGLTGGNVLQGALLGGAGGAVSGMMNPATNSVGGTAAVLQAADPSLTAVQAMDAAQAYANAGITTSQLASTLNIPSSVFTSPTSGVSGTTLAQSAAPALTSLPTGGMTDAIIAGALNPATAGNVGLASGLATPAAGISSTLAGVPLAGTTAGMLGAGLSALPAGGMTATGGVPAADAALGGVGAAVVPAVGAAGGLLGNAGGLLGTGISGTQLASTGLGMLGSVLQGNAATDAAQTAANAQIEAARIAADAAKFRPVGVTTRFGSSNFGYDANGNLITAGYTPSADIKAQQDRLMAMSGQALGQYEGAMGATAPMGQAAQTLFGLGQGYLATTPQQQAAKYMADQQALLATSRDRQLAQLQNQMMQQGRLGLATGATGMMGAANPELEAFYNAQRQQDLGLAAQATQGGMDYAKFGAGMVGTGGDLLSSMYGTQAAAYNPYQTALGGATQLEQLAQQPMDIGTAIGAKTSTAAANAGELMARGMTGAAQTMQPANAYSPWGAMLTGAGSAIGNYQAQQQQQQQQDPLIAALWGK